MNDTITVYYTCAGCGLREIPVVVAVRQPSEDVRVWTAEVVRILSADHKQRTQGTCTQNAMQEIKIPMAGTGGVVGGVTRH